MESAAKITEHAEVVRDGAIAQLGERIVRNDEVVGSSPTSSTISFEALSDRDGVAMHHSAAIYCSSNEPGFAPDLRTAWRAYSRICSTARR